MVGGQPEKTTQVTEVKYPEWVEKASEENYEFAKDVSNKPFEQYQGQRVADKSMLTELAEKLLVGSVGENEGAYARANELYEKSAGPLDIETYFNPYIQQVEQKTLNAADRSRRQALMQVSDDAISAGAFGGSRHGIVEGVTNAEALRDMGLLSADLHRQGFDTAANLAQGDRAAQQSAAGGLLTTAGAKTKDTMAKLASMFGAGMQDQMHGQQVIDADMERFREARDYDLERLNTRLSALGMSPYGKSESTEKETSGGGGADFGAIFGGILGLLPLMFSDREEKTDIKKLGKDPQTGLDMYAYRYKGDPKSYPKVVGPMAQDIEKQLGRGVREIGGTKVVDIQDILNG